MADADKSSSSEKQSDNYDGTDSPGTELTRERMPRPLLVEDGAGGDVPPHVTRLLGSIRAERERSLEHEQPPHDAAAMDLLMGILFVLVVETGFTPSEAADPFTPSTDFVAANVRCISQMPRGWRDPERARRGGGLYQVTFQLAAFPENPCRLVGVLCADVMIVNMMTTAAPREAFSQTFSPRDLVDVDGSVRVGGLRGLAHRFKDRVVAPLKAALFNCRKLRNASLLGIPNELQVLVAAGLAPQDLVRLARTCRPLAGLLNEQKLWRRHVRVKFPSDYARLVEREEAAARTPAEGEGAAGGAGAPAEEDAEPVDWRLEYRKLCAGAAASAAATRRAVDRRVAMFNNMHDEYWMPPAPLGPFGLRGPPPFPFSFGSLFNTPGHGQGPRRGSSPLDAFLEPLDLDLAAGPAMHHLFLPPS